MSDMTETLQLTQALCARRSITPDDGGCQALVAERLRAVGFQVESLKFGDVANLWAWHGSVGKTLAFLGHTDVVPVGDRDAWNSDPFQPELRDGLLYARGAADMKGSVAAMVVALERFVKAHPEHGGVVGILLTSDEEGVAEDGIKRVADAFTQRGQRIDYCLVGEPSSDASFGDRIRIGRRGSLHAHIKVRGVQGHVAYPEKALNPIHHVAPALAALAARRWDSGNAHFPATSFQISNIHAGTGATNIIPAELNFDANFRFGTASRAEDLMRETENILARANLDYRIRWVLSGAPFLTAHGALLQATQAALLAETGAEALADTGGGTSDGRFIAPMGAEVVELGPINATIHKVNECVSVADLARLERVYLDILNRLMAPGRS